MGVIPLSDASRRPTRFPVMTASIIAVNAVMFVIELVGGDTFVTTWSLHPADIVAGRHLITILTSMFMHGSWSHILGNMVFLWAFGPEIEDLMGRRKYLVFYLLGGLAATAAQSRPTRARRSRTSAPVERSLPSWARFSSPTRATEFAHCS